MRVLWTALGAAALLTVSAMAPQTASAQPASAPTLASPPPPAPQTSPPGVIIPAGTPVVIELVDTLKASTSKEGQQFRLRLAEPLVVGGQTVVPAGAEGGGEVVEAKGPGLGGRPAVLILAARYLVSDGVRIPLGHLRYGSTGQDNTNLSLAVSIAVGLPGALVGGGDVKAPAGMRAAARVTSDVALPPACPSQPQLPPPASSPAPSSSAAPPCQGDIQ